MMMIPNQMNGKPMREKKARHKKKHNKTEIIKIIHETDIAYNHWHLMFGPWTSDAKFL